MADRYGSACIVPKSAPFPGVCAVKAKKIGQVLVRTLGCEKASDFSHRNRVMSGDLKVGRQTSTELLDRRADRQGVELSRQLEDALSAAAGPPSWGCLE